MTTNSEILDWATEVDSVEQTVAVLDAIATRANELKGNLLAEVELPPVTPPPSEADLVGTFAPFSMITSGMKRFEDSDSSYVAMRNLIQTTLFPESLNAGYNQRRQARTASSVAINHMVRITPAHLTTKDWYAGRVQRLKDYAGVEIIPGKGVTFADPEKAYKAFENRTQQAPVDGSRVIINRNFLRFAELLTA